MFIPIRTDYRMTHTPWVNYALIAANVLIFLAGYNGGSATIDPLLLDPGEPSVAQFFTSMFLHGGWQHLLGNMLFLWIFGNALNDRFGHVAYLAFYLAGGVLAGVGYILLSGRAPVLGASGAISAVTGAYLVLFPRVRVLVLMIFYFITTIQVSSLLFVGLQVVYNVLMTLTGAGGGVAYTAHVSGYLFGIGTAAALLALRVLPRDAMDLLNLFGQGRRRQRYQRMVSQGYNPFMGKTPSRPAESTSPGSKWVSARSVESLPTDTQSARELDLRREIAAACSRHDLPEAASKYLQLVQIAEGPVLSRQNQLDVANQLMASEQYPAAADAYERFLRHYTTYEHTADIHLMLGLLYGRYLHQYDQAETLLQRAVEALRDPRKVEMAREELQAVRRRRNQ
jgi:membrane associated rhomboid family serine protease